MIRPGWIFKLQCLHRLELIWCFVNSQECGTIISQTLKLLLSTIVLHTRIRNKEYIRLFVISKNRHRQVEYRIWLELVRCTSEHFGPIYVNGMMDKWKFRRRSENHNRLVRCRSEKWKSHQTCRVYKWQIVVLISIIVHLSLDNWNKCRLLMRECASNKQWH